MCWTADEDRCLQPIIAEDDVKVVKILKERFFSSPFYPNFHYTINENAHRIPIILEQTYWVKNDIINQGYHSMRITPNTRLVWIEAKDCYKWRNNTFTPDECLFDAIIPKGTKYYENECGEIVSETIRIIGKSNTDDYEIPVIHMDFDVLLKDGNITTYLQCVDYGIVNEIIGINASAFTICEDDKIFVSIRKKDYKEGHYADAVKNFALLFDGLYLSLYFYNKGFLNLIGQKFGLSPTSIWVQGTFGPAQVYFNRQGAEFNKAWIPKILHWGNKGIFYKSEN